MIVTELSKGTKLYLLVGGRGTRLASVTNGRPKPLVDIQHQSFLDYVLDNLSGFDITLVCSDLNYDHFKIYEKYGVEVFNEGSPSGTGGFLPKVDLPESFYVMNGDTFFSGELNLDCDESTIFVAEEEVTHDVGYIRGESGRVKFFVEKNPNAHGKELVSLGIYKLYRDDIEIPDKLPISMEYDILPEMELSYKILKTKRFDIGTPERLQTFKDWVC
jgi:NDP-sugar pyrophosphorylase family protein|tara:strand:- start:708 stop:1358 length:651 start_codon:yes stop_codon:yes gene_type:complete